MAAPAGVVFLCILCGTSLWVAASGQIWATLEGFKQSLGRGLLCGLVPFYSWYFTLALYEGEDRWAMILAAVVTNLIFSASAVALMAAGAGSFVAGFYLFSAMLLGPVCLGALVVGVVISLRRGRPAESGG